MDSYDVAIIGGYFFDQIYTGLPQFPELGREICTTGVTTTGGGMFITAVALARLGAKVAWPVYFGSDYYSEYVYKLAAAEGIDLSLAKIGDQPYRQVTTSMPFQGERAFVTYADPTPEDMYKHWLARLDNCHFRHLHLGGMMGKDLMFALMDRAWAQGATVSMDCGDGPHLEKPCDCRELVAQIDIFMPNSREARIIAEKADLMDAIGVLMQSGRMVVVKDGPNGVWIGHNGEIIHEPGVRVGPVVDTTGAGDCFNAGFLYGYVVERAALNVCARYGNICGGYSVTGVGGATTAPTHRQLIDLAGREVSPS
jgi:sugar/nucleoside kinase (ribokinase family)